MLFFIFVVSFFVFPFSFLLCICLQFFQSLGCVFSILKEINITYQKKKMKKCFCVVFFFIFALSVLVFLFSFCLCRFFSSFFVSHSLASQLLYLFSSLSSLFLFHLIFLLFLLSFHSSFFLFFLLFSLQSAKKIDFRYFSINLVF